MGRAGVPPPTLRPAAFHLGIWTDIPAGPQSWSHPGQMIWETTVPWAATQEALVGCDFHSAQMQSPDTCFLYSYKLPREHWFYQDPTENRVYWLSIAARYPEGAPQEYRWGWKTRSPSVIDTAVRILAPTAPKLWDPFVAGEPIIVAEQTWDMAFALTTPSYDFGDAPDAGYRTVLASDGARHILSPGGPYMGMGVDTELDGQPNPLASGDDMTTTDDEDGVTLAAAWVVGQPAGHSVDLLQSPAGCYLNVWADFDHNGSWLDPGEQIATDALLTAGMTYTLSFAVPSFPAARPGITYARYRCSSQAGSARQARRSMARWKTIACNCSLRRRRRS